MASDSPAVLTLVSFALRLFGFCKLCCVEVDGFSSLTIFLNGCFFSSTAAVVSIT